MSQRTHHSKPVHVLMLLDSTYPKSIGGGTEAQLGKLAKALRARHQRVTIVTPLLAAQPPLADPASLELPFCASPLTQPAPQPEPVRARAWSPVAQTTPSCSADDRLGRTTST